MCEPLLSKGLYSFFYKEVTFCKLTVFIEKTFNILNVLLFSKSPTCCLLDSFKISVYYTISINYGC